MPIMLKTSASANRNTKLTPITSQKTMPLDPPTKLRDGTAKKSTARRTSVTTKTVAGKRIRKLIRRLRAYIASSDQVSGVKKPERGAR